MKYFDKMSDSKKKFLNFLGIFSDDDFPKGFFEIIKSAKDDLSESEKLCIGDYNTCYCYNSKIDMGKLVGTDHDRYASKSWIEAFCDLDRGDKNIELFFQNPNYYLNEDVDLVDMGVIEKDNVYYIYGKCGGGNNRLIMMKLFYFASETKGKKSFSPLVRVRKVPSKQTADNLFYCMYPDGGYSSSGLNVIKVDTNSEEEIYNVQEGFQGPVILKNINGNEILDSVKNLNNNFRKNR